MKSPDGWWEGKVCDKVGLFPGSFVEVGVLRVVACASLTAVVTVNCDAYCSLSVCVRACTHV